jgi:hypothetical protein
MVKDGIEIGDFVREKSSSTRMEVFKIEGLRIWCEYEDENENEDEKGTTITTYRIASELEKWSD